MFARLKFVYSSLVILLHIVAMIAAMSLFPSRKGYFIHRLNASILHCLGAKLSVRGEADESAQFFLMNHQGIIDIIAMEASSSRHLNWIAKKELFDAPLFGALLRVGEMISIDREDRRGLVGLKRNVQKSLEVKKRPVAIFPEGTRAAGQRLLPFKDGARFLAETFKAKVQPVVILGSRTIVNDRRKISGRGDVILIYLPSVDVSQAGKGWYENLRETMQRTIDEAEANEGLTR